jgi:NDP-sugar pyrophosphorylase family protein
VLPFQGLTDKDYLLHEGRLLSGPIRIEASQAAAKGEMRCYFEGELLAGANWIQAGVYLQSRSGKITIGNNCIIQSGAYLEGPLTLGDRNEVRQGAFIRSQVLSGTGCILGHASEFKGVILHDHAKGPHFAYVGDSILGAHVNLGAGTKVSNLKITGSEIMITINGQKYPTGMRKLGGILGDQVETGCNSVLNPGVILGRESMVYPAIAVRSGYYPPKSWLKGEVMPPPTA